MSETPEGQPEFTEAEKLKATQLQEMFDKANALASQLGSEYGIGVNPDSGKLEAFQMYLIEIGILTREQLLDFELQTTARLIKIMNDMRAQAEAKKRSAGLIKPANHGAPLVGLDGNPLLGKR